MQAVRSTGLATDQSTTYTPRAIILARVHCVEHLLKGANFSFEGRPGGPERYLYHPDNLVLGQNISVFGPVFQQVKAASTSSQRPHPAQSQPDSSGVEVEPGSMSATADHRQPARRGGGQMCSLMIRP